MNEMVFKLQPDIIVNNRNGLRWRFRHARAAHPGRHKRAWESCMTMNDSWGYQRADDNWKTPKTIVRNLMTCAHDTGNYLLNIGPKPDGSIPEESVRILTRGGQVDGAQRHSHLRTGYLPAAALQLSPASRATATRSTCTCISGPAKRWRWPA